MPRNAFGELRVHLRTLQWLGVLRFGIDFEKCLVRIEVTEERRSRFFLAGVTVLSCSLIIYSCCYPYHFIMGKHNNTGNCYALINIRSCALATLLVYIQLYARRCRFAKLLESMLHLNRICWAYNGVSGFGSPYILHLALFVSCMINYAHGYWVAGVTWTTIPIYLLQYGFSYLILGQLMVLFACFQRILLSTLRHCNRTLLENLKSGATESGKFHENFREYNQLLWLSHVEINQCFGLLLLPITGFVLLITPSGPFFLVSTIFEGRYRQAWRFVFMSITALFWSLPWVILLVLAMGTNNVQQERSLNRSSMSPVCRDLRLYLRLLHLLGMMCWHFDSEHCQLLATPSCERYARTFMVVILAATTGFFTFAHLNPELLHMAVYNRTGNFYETVIFRSTCLVLFLLYVILYVRRHRHRELVQHLLRLNRRCVTSSRDRQFLHNLILYGVLSLVCFGNYFNGYSRSGLAPLPLAFCMVVYMYAFLVLCLLLMFFVCLKQIMAAGLVHYNQLLDQGNLATGLRGRQQILALCGGELSDCFGQLMLPIVALVLLMAPSGPFYLISTVMEGKFDSRGYLVMLLISSTWDTPWMIILVIMLRTNGITVEANKTAKILAKVPRTGTGLDRMIEKFLLKNLRQQPILTAYGFFALDKSTLFKLFTAIFTYMVILVQFKEMENTTKAISKF